MANVFLFAPGFYAVLFVSIRFSCLSCAVWNRTTAANHQPQSAAEYVVPTLDIHSTSLTLTWVHQSCSSRLTDFPPYRPRSTICRPATLVAVLLLLAGDVPLNPRPTTNRPAQISSKFAPRNYNSARNKTRTLHSSPLHLGLLNCRSAVSKIALIHDLINDRNLDVTVLSKTWFTSDTPQSMLLDQATSGYAALHVVRPTGPGKPSRGGKFGDGLAAVFRESVPVRVHHLASNVQLPITFELQLLCVDAAGNGSSTPFTVVHVYRPPWMSTVSTSVDELADIIAMITTDCSGDVLVCGDLNCPGPDDSSVDVKLAECF